MCLEYLVMDEDPIVLRRNVRSQKRSSHLTMVDWGHNFADVMEEGTHDGLLIRTIPLGASSGLQPVFHHVYMISDITVPQLVEQRQRPLGQVRRSCFLVEASNCLLQILWSCHRLRARPCQHDGNIMPSWQDHADMMATRCQYHGKTMPTNIAKPCQHNGKTMPKLRASTNQWKWESCACQFEVSVGARRRSVMCGARISGPISHIVFVPRELFCTQCVFQNMFLLHK